MSQCSPIDDVERAFVFRLARHVAGEDAAAPPLLGEGSNNRVYRVHTPQGPLALKLGKPHRLSFAAAEHEKEIWCAAAARARNISTPAIDSASHFEGRPYQLQEFVAGEPASDRMLALEVMGQWARVFHAIPVSGWGPNHVGEGVFADDWRQHVAYNIESLGPNDGLRDLGVLDAETSSDLRRRLERLATAAFHIGLCHGDLSLRNILVEDNGRHVLIDWGCATAAPVPHYEINEMLRTGHATAGELDIFRKAYGLTDSAYEAILADLPDLLALREVDTLRWALDRQPSAVPEMIERARRAISELKAS